MDFFEVLVGDVSVDLGGGDVGVAEHGLDGAEVGAIHEKVGSEAVAEGVWGNVLGDTGHFGVFLDDTLDGARSEAAEVAGSIGGLEIFAIIKEERVERICAGIEVVGEAFGSGDRDEDRAVFATFTADDELATV